MFDKNTDMETPADAIAIIGLSGRFPGAANVRQFWENLRAGKESIRFFSDRDMAEAGVDAALLQDPGYVKAGAALDGAEDFAASFFGFTPKEAELTDPQHRVFIECAWEAMEDAGYVAEHFQGRIGVYAGTGLNTYMIANLLPNYRLLESMGVLQLVIGNKADFMPTKVSYKLNLNGASVNVNTACSTSLVAVHMACRSLLNYECDMVLAGGVTIEVPQQKGYLYQQGGVLSPDGHCRAFDAKAQGTVSGSGAGVVLLKRLEEALQDGDHIYAVIRGSAINNDGAQKIGYTAPSVEGQKEVIALALAMAEVEPDSISYVEAHGTGTALGDPIEVSALTQAFRMGTDQSNFCAIGSVKTNIGHLDAAAGIASLIKTALCLEHRELVPSLHYEQANPSIDFASTPFYVNTALRPWTAGRDGAPLRAGVSSFGIGGTNAHVILEQAPRGARADSRRQWQLLLLSAQSGTALEAATDNLQRHLRHGPGAKLADVAYTLQTGRRAFPHRRMVVCKDSGDAATALELRDPKRSLCGVAAARESGGADVVFMFPGIGDQSVNMAAGLYREVPVFRETIDACAAILRPLLGLDLRELLYPQGGAQEEAAHGTMDLRKMLNRPAQGAAAQEPERAGPAWMRKTSLVHPALFMVEYALAKTYIDLGVRPAAMIGHSLGEYVAACVAGVMSLEDALTVVARRASLIQDLPEGRMLAVALAAAALQPMVADGLSVAAINGPAASVVAGPGALMGALEQHLKNRGIAHLPVQSSHAFHSSMLAPLQAPLRALFASIELKAPLLPYISNLSGTWISAEQATDPDYWVKHTCQTVRFGDGIQTLCDGAAATFIEMGPGQTLSSFLQQHPAAQARDNIVALPSLPGAHGGAADAFVLTHTIGTLWCLGHPIDWASYHRDETPARVSLPTYPFERERYWIDALNAPARADAPAPQQGAGLLYQPVWSSSRIGADAARAVERRHWLVFQDEGPIAAALVQRLLQRNQLVVLVGRGERFERRGDASYTVRAGSLDDYAMLAAALKDGAVTPHNVLHLWALAQRDDVGETYASLLCLARTFGAAEADAGATLQLAVVTEGLHAVTGEEQAASEKALLLGPCRVLPLEFPNIRCCNIDVAISAAAQAGERMIDGIMHEFDSGLPRDIAAYRGYLRWTRAYQALTPLAAAPPVPRQDAVYLIGDYRAGDLSHLLAGYLARQGGATLLLMVQAALPPRDEWARHLAAPQERAALCETMRGVLEIENLGARVELFDGLGQGGDAAAYRQVAARHPRLAGVLHALPSFGYGLIQFENAALGAAVAAQTQRARALTLALEQLAPDFVAFFSSNLGLAGAAGQLDACSANAYIQSCADQLFAARRKPVLSVSIDVRGLGTADDASAAFPPALSGAIEAGRQRYAIDREQLDAVLADVLHAGKAQLAVSASELGAVIDGLRGATLPALLQQVKQAGAVRSHGQRPPYAAPQTDIELQVAAIWENLLGSKQIGLDDNFFNLGGNSLLAVQFISRVREAYQIDLSLKSLFQAATVGEVSGVVEGILLREIEALSDDEVGRRMRQAAEPADAEADHDRGRTSVEPSRYELPNKLVVQQFNQVETDHFYHDIFESKVYFRNGITLDDGAVIFDVGANIGLFSLFAHHQCKDARIYAFEPAPPVFELLQMNLKAYAVNATLFKCGVANLSRKEKLTFYPHSTGMSSFHADKEDEKDVLRAIMHNQLDEGMPGMQQVMAHVDEILEERFRDTSYECELVTLSDIIGSHRVERIDLLKIDVQKSELEVLEGIQAQHWRIIRQLVIEVHDLDGRVERVRALLEARGYRVVVQQELLYRTSSISNLYAIRA
ncbi:FkbM family methyltransferase [Janthinobacterium sp. CG_23.3]|uniref:FkbM family methyltransferase n=1 Tax=Janthinobacterium sp. CG_23.3 TaxID=3349634 RepID=UPI0038D4CC9B